MPETAPVAEPAAEPGDETPPRSFNWSWLAAVLLIPVALGIVFAAFHATSSGSKTRGVVHTSTTTPRASTSAPTSTAPSTTTTTAPPAPAVPSSPQPSADAAATALVSSWATGNQARALTVATPAAVSTLFARPYHSGLAVDRGCNSAAGTATCAFGPPGGASPTDPLYQLQVVQTGGFWYVSAVQVLGQ